MNWTYLLIGFLSVADATIGGYVLLKNSSRSLNRSFFAFAFGMALIGIGMTLLFMTHNILFDRVIFFGGYLMVLGMVLLSFKFPANEPMRPVAWLLFLPLAALAAATPFGFLVKEVIFRADGILEPVNGPGMPVFAAVIVAYAILSGWNFWHRYKGALGPSRLQMQYLGLGAGVFAAAILVFNVLLPSFGVFEFNILGPLASVVFVGLVGYAMIRHRLLDIRVVIQLGAIYLALLTVIASFYIAIVFAAGTWLQSLFDGQGSAFLIVGIATVCLGIFTVPALERYLRRATDMIFFKDRYDYPRALHDLSEILNQNIETSRIIKRTSQALKDIFRTGEAHIILFRDRSSIEVALPWYGQLRSMVFGGKEAIILARWFTESQGDLRDRLRGEHGIELIAPIFLSQRPIGAIVLGPKLSGDPYRDEDAALLNTLSNQLAVGLEKARLFGKLKKYSGTLEERVHERTVELERLQEEQRQMMVDISHRLQTPLTIMKSEVGLMKKRKPSEQMDAFERSIDGISKFIYDLLNLARLGAKKRDFRNEKLDLSILLKDLVEYFGVMAASKNIQLSSRIDPEVAVFGNKDQLEELMTNLTSNAFKYLDARRNKEVLVTLSKSGDRLVLEIADNGRGIAPEDLDKIFERFYRGRGTDENIVDGTGLGLAIAKRITENHNGKISIQSSPGTGTKVAVELPSL